MKTYCFHLVFLYLFLIPAVHVRIPEVTVPPKITAIRKTRPPESSASLKIVTRLQ